MREELSAAITERDEFEDANFELQEQLVQYDTELERMEDENGEVKDTLAVSMRRVNPI